MITISFSIVNILVGGWETTYDHLMSMKNFTFDNEQDILISSKNYEECDQGVDLDMLRCLY